MRLNIECVFENSAFGGGAKRNQRSQLLNSPVYFARPCEEHLQITGRQPVTLQTISACPERFLRRRQAFLFPTGSPPRLFRFRTDFPSQERDKCGRQEHWSDQCCLTSTGSRCNGRFELALITSRCAVMIGDLATTQRL